MIKNKDNNIENFKQSLSRKTNKSEVPLSKSIVKNIPIYEGKEVNEKSLEEGYKIALLREWSNVFKEGSGIIVIKKGIPNLKVISEATSVFTKLIEIEKEKFNSGGDHFAKPGANDRVWNALEKHCIYDPENFCQYYSSPSIRLASEAWLGPCYQVTAQINRVNPGGEAQTAHRDYHLGFMTVEQASKYPEHVHTFSPFLTLQGAVAHCDMPIESGPTKLLPFSQNFTSGYLVYGNPEYQEHFENNYVQIPLEIGDLIFFNPAILHAAGNNTSSDIFRMANLLQISSPFGRAMETVNRLKMSLTVYPILLDAKLHNKISEIEIDNIIAACSESYSFPTNLDLDPPENGLAPLTQAQIMRKALNEKNSLESLKKELIEQSENQKS